MREAIYLWVGLEAPDRNRCVVCGGKSYGFIRDELTLVSGDNSGCYCAVHLAEREPMALLRSLVGA